MTNKKEIIIDGVDVYKCVSAKRSIFGVDVECRLGGDCSQNPNCYYKQLKRKEKRIKNVFYKTYKNWVWYVANGINASSDKITQSLLTDLIIVTKALSMLANIEDGTLNYYSQNIKVDIENV